jgi:hypothetical protein
MPVPGPLLKGLLPGRGPVGRPMPVPVPNGLLPGRGPAGRPAGRGASGSATGTAAAAAGAAGSASAAAGAGTGGATGAGEGGEAGIGSAAGCSAASAGALAGTAAVFVAALVFLAALVFFAAGLASAGGIASRRRLATGASTVEDADFTNSPMSCNLARTSLLVTPSSLASSWTRTFDTTLLSWSGQGAPDRQCMRHTFIVARSWGVHPRTPGPFDRRPSPVTCDSGGCPSRSCAVPIACSSAARRRLRSRGPSTRSARTSALVRSARSRHCTDRCR